MYSCTVQEDPIIWTGIPLVLVNVVQDHLVGLFSRPNYMGIFRDNTSV